MEQEFSVSNGAQRAFCEVAVEQNSSQNILNSLIIANLFKDAEMRREKRFFFLGSLKRFFTSSGTNTCINFAAGFTFFLWMVILLMQEGSERSQDMQIYSVSVLLISFLIFVSGCFTGVNFFSNFKINLFSKSPENMKRCVDALSVFINNEYCNSSSSQRDAHLKNLLSIFTENRFSMAFSLLLFFVPIFSSMTMRYEKLKKGNLRQKKVVDKKSRERKKELERAMTIDRIKRQINSVNEDGLKEDLLIKALKNLD